MESKQVGTEIALVINELDRSDKIALLKALVKNLDRSSKIQLENVMEVVI